MPNPIPGVKPKPPELCKWCGKPAPGDSTECDNCWEMRVRIQADLKLAKDMIEFLETNEMIEELEGEQDV